MCGKDCSEAKKCVKVLRVYDANTTNQKEPMAMRDDREPLARSNIADTLQTFLWRSTSLGVTMSTTPLQSVSEWVPNGTLMEYVNPNSHADRVSLVRIQLLLAFR